MNPFFHTDFSISDSLKIVWKSVLIYETIIVLILTVPNFPNRIEKKVKINCPKYKWKRGTVIVFGTEIWYTKNGFKKRILKRNYPQMELKAKQEEIIRRGDENADGS